MRGFRLNGWQRILDWPLFSDLPGGKLLANPCNRFTRSGLVLLAFLRYM